MDGQRPATTGGHRAVVGEVVVPPLHQAVDRYRSRLGKTDGGFVPKGHPHLPGPVSQGVPGEGQFGEDGEVGGGPSMDEGLDPSGVGLRVGKGRSHLMYDDPQGW